MARLAAQEATARQRCEETAWWRDEAPTTRLSTISAAFSPVRVVLSFFPSLLLGYLVLGDGDVVAALVDEVEHRGCAYWATIFFQCLHR